MNIIDKLVAKRAELASGRRREHGRRGMTLLEVMVVIAILLMVIGIVGVGVMNQFESAKADATRLQISKIAQQVDIYMVRKKKAPSSSEGLKAAYGSQDVPSDSWGNEFVYISPGPNGMPYDIISYGADGTEGGTDSDEDIKYSDMKQ